MTEVKELIAHLEMVKEDSTVPKNIKGKIGEILDMLNNEEDLSIKINRIQSELEEMANDNNMQPMTRTQIYSIMSIVESLAS